MLSPAQFPHGLPGPGTAEKAGEYEELRLYDEPIRAMDPQRLPHREELLARGGAYARLYNSQFQPS